jgi:Peptidase C10 family.
MNCKLKPMAANPQRASVKRTNSNKTAIAPLIKAQWDQGLPYCLLCPDDEDEKCITGCVATALAQVMYHHRWPTSVDAISGYTTIRKEIVVDELPATTFEWDKMKDTYTYDDSSDAAYEVAKLMRYCGQALKMDYTSEGSCYFNKIGRAVGRGRGEVLGGGGS